jgi:PAS domain S-box-containing protein
MTLLKRLRTAPRRAAQFVLGPERNALLFTLLALVAMVILWSMVANQYQASLVDQQRVRLQEQLAGYENSLITSLGRRLVLLQALRAWTEAELNTHGGLDQQEFVAVARGLFETSSGNHAIWLAPGGIQTYVYPPQEPGIGADLLHTQPPEKALDALKAVTTHEIVVSRPELTGTGYDLQARLAVNSQNGFWGLVTITIDLPSVFADAGLDAAQDSADIALCDSPSRANCKVIYGDAQLFGIDNRIVVAPIDFPGGSWQLAAIPKSGWLTSVQDTLTLVWVFGLVAVALIGGLIYTSLNRQSRLETAVSERTHQLDQELGERRRVEQSLRESEEKYRTVVETSADAILLQTPAGLIVDCNMAAERLFDYSHQELCRMQMADLAPVEVAGLLPERMTAEMTTSGVFVDTFYRKSEGRTFAAEVSSQMIVMGGETLVLLYIRDISQRKQAAEALRDSEERYRSLVETSPDAIALTDLRGRIVICNQKAADICEYASAEQMLGMSVFELLAPEDRKRAFDNTRKLYRGGEYRDVDYTAITLSGRRFPCELSATTIYDKQGRPSGYTGIMRDVSERKQQAREQAAVVVVASALRTAITLDEIVQNILNQLLGMLNSEAAAIFVVDSATGDAECVRGVSRWSAWTGMRLAPDEGLTGRLIRTGQPFVNNDLLHNPQTARLELMGGLNAVAGAPLIAQERTIGALWVGRTAPFREGELRVLMVIADMAANAVQRAALFEDLQKSSGELEEAYDRTLEGWSRALELRDRETEGHTRRAAEYTVALGRALGMSEDSLLHVRRGALLHDIGKLGIPDKILLKPGPLSEEEWSIMRLHPTYAYQLLEPIPYLGQALDIPYCHHEHWDGSGYPQGLSGEQIPLAARIFCVVDVWDAITSNRVYRPAWPLERARQYLVENAGVQFDPRVVEMFFKVVDERAADNHGAT